MTMKRCLVLLLSVRVDGHHGRPGLFHDHRLLGLVSEHPTPLGHFGARQKEPIIVLIMARVRVIVVSRGSRNRSCNRTFPVDVLRIKDLPDELGEPHVGVPGSRVLAQYVADLPRFGACPRDIAEQLFPLSLQPLRLGLCGSFRIGLWPLFGLLALNHHFIVSFPDFQDRPLAVPVSASAA
jgi:hypothetical protein